MWNFKPEIFFQILGTWMAILAWVISFIQLRRSRRQNNEDIIFQSKIEAYRQIISGSFEFLEKSYFILDELSDFKGGEKEWTEKKMPDLYRSLNPLVDRLHSLFMSHVLLFPEKFIKTYNDFLFKSQRLLVEHYNFDNKVSIETYFTLTEMHEKLINDVRQDLHIVLLSEKLNYRLKR